MTAKPDGIQTTPTHSSRKAALGKADFVIQTDQLHKQYGRIEALKNVSLGVRRGEIFGLLGQNGAGKTTLIKILLGITKLTTGHAELLGEAAGTVSVRRRVGYLPEDHRFPDYHTGGQPARLLRQPARSAAYTPRKTQRRNCSNWSASRDACTTKFAPTPRA